MVRRSPAHRRGHSSSVLVLVIAVCLSSFCARPEDSAGPESKPAAADLAARRVVIERELMITDLSVVNDPRASEADGPWSFGGLMKAMAGETDPSRFVVQWLKTWESDQVINGFRTAARPTIRDLVIHPWKARDGQAGTPDSAWTINFANAPFRLLAIVNRLDLAKGTPPRVDTGGEGHFVFGVLGPPSAGQPASAGPPLPFTVSLEFEQAATTRAELRVLAQQWHGLGAMTFGEAFNTGLQQITDRFSGKNRAPAKPNGSALNQLRTNEIALSPSRGWELREFTLANGFLRPAPTAQSPSNTFQNTIALRDFINEHEADILRRGFRIPARFRGAPFLAGSSRVAPPVAPPAFAWRVPPPVNSEARHLIALASCNGCHHLETGTTTVVHIANRAPGAMSQLSRFLTGNADGSPFGVNGQGLEGTRREFNDLEQRAAILSAAAVDDDDARLNAARAARAFRVH